MIINMFKNECKTQEYKNNISPKMMVNKDISIKELKKFVIKNYLDFLQKNAKEELKIKISEYLINELSFESDKANEKIDILFDEMFGYGFLQKYIENKNVSDIRVVRYDLIYIKEIGKWKKVEDKFENSEEFNEFLRYCAIKNGAKINHDVPIIVVSDKYFNLRIEIGIEPVNVNSSSLVIRIHRSENKSLEILFVCENMLDADSYKIINSAIIQKNNIIISGKGGSGKTTLLRSIIKSLPDNISISINEETAELNITGKNIIQREILQNRENKIGLEKLMQHSLVMSNDVIVVGEMKGSETSVFIDAISTGHIGYATVHSDNCENTLTRLITLFKRDVRAQSYKEEFISQILASSIDYIIYMENYSVYQICKISFDKKSEKAIIESIYKKGEL